MSFISNVVCVIFCFLCVLAEASVYKLSEDLTTAANDSFTNNCFELVFGVKHPTTSLVVYVNGTLRADQGHCLSLTVESMFVCMYK